MRHVLLTEPGLRSLLAVVRLVITAALGIVWADPLWALDRTWIGGNNNWDSSSSNWSPADEPDSDDQAIFNTSDFVFMTIDQTLEGLDLSGGMNLSTGTQFANVNGTIDLDDSNTMLTVHTNALLGGTPPVTSINADDIIVTGGAEFRMANDVTIHDTSNLGGSDADFIGVMTIGSGSTLSGNGRLLFNNSISSSFVLLQNNGTISALSYGNGGFFTSETFTIDAPDRDARIDLDGTGGSSIVNVFREQTLDMNIRQSDDFDGTINLFHNTVIDFEHNWELNGVMDVENGFIAGTPPLIPDTPAGDAVVAGGKVTMNESDSRINVVHNDGTLQLDAELDADDGVIDNNGHLIFNAPADIGSSVDFFMEFDADVTVNDVVTVNDADWNWDDNGGSNNDLTINDAGVLNANITAAGASTWNGDMHIVGGTLNVQGDNNDWEQIGSNITFEGASLGRIEGDLFVLTGGTFRSAAGANGDVASSTRWAGGTLDVDGELELLGTVEWAGGTVTGDGILEQEGNATVTANTTIGVTTYDWDQSTTTINPGVTFAVDVSTIDRSDDKFDNNTITVDRGTLSVTVAAGHWIMNGLLDLRGNTGPDNFAVQLDGDDVELRGTVDVVDQSQIDARVDITGTVNLTTASTTLRLTGGTVDTNRIEGGIINGPGVLSSSGITTLQGFGTINSDVAFVGPNPILRADDGELTINGAILDVGTLSSTDDGILNITNPWFASSAATVSIGGELRGALVTNNQPSHLFFARGLISAPIVNETRITSSGLLTIADNNLNDYDGVSNSGALEANGGDITLHRDAPDGFTINFNGTIEATNGRSFILDNVRLDFAPGSTLELNNGTFRANNFTVFGGTIEVSGVSSIERFGTGTTFSVFDDGSTTNLNGDLQLEFLHTIRNGATFTGAGTLVNMSTLDLDDGADVDVLVENRAPLRLLDFSSGSSMPSQASVSELVQTSSGRLFIRIAGTGVNENSRLLVDGAAQLAGQLDLSLQTGYNPELHDTFTILTAGSVTGTFSSLADVLAPLDPGFAWEVVYNPTGVQVVVVPALEGDFNVDGVVDALDYVLWRDNLGAADESALNNNGDGMNGVDIEDYNLWVANYGTGINAALSQSQNAAVPEPSAALLLLAMATCLAAKVRYLTVG